MSTLKWRGVLRMETLLPRVRLAVRAELHCKFVNYGHVF
jgi:hypothetical protein